MLVHWTAEDVVNRINDVLRVYAEAMDYPLDLTMARRGFLYTHTQRAGFRAVATLAADDQLLGFSYGYTTAPGQWWHDQVRSVLDPAVYAAWMTDCFEVVELHVRPDVQGQGLGERQLLALVEGAPERTVVLSTPEAPEQTSRAWRLYRRLGFVDLVRHFRFPGDDRPFAVLGQRLPLHPTHAGRAGQARHASQAT